MKINKAVRITGLVQGVFFRQSTLFQAEGLGVVGWVKNASDGSVLAEVEGEQTQVSKLLSWMENGPSAAKVSGIETTEGPVKDYPDFRIIR